MLPDIRAPGCLTLLSGVQAAIAYTRPTHNRRKGRARNLSSQLVPLGNGVKAFHRPPVRALEDIVDSLQRASSLTGRWHKDKEASDSMEEVCDMVALSWILRKALVLLNTLELEDTPEKFTTNLKAGGIMDVMEE